MDKINFFFLNSGIILFFYLFSYYSTIGYYYEYIDTTFIKSTSRYSGLFTIISAFTSNKLFRMKDKYNYIINFGGIFFLNFLIFFIPLILKNIILFKVIFIIHVIIKSYLICYFLGLNMNFAIQLGYKNYNYLNIGVSIGSLLGSSISLFLSLFIKNIYTKTIVFYFIQILYTFFYLYLLYINISILSINDNKNKKSEIKKNNLFITFKNLLCWFTGNIITNFIGASVFPNVLISLNFNGFSKDISTQIVTFSYKLGNILGKYIPKKYSTLNLKLFHILNMLIFVIFIIFILILIEIFKFNAIITFIFIFLFGIYYGFLNKVALIQVAINSKNSQDQQNSGFLYSYCVKGGMGIGLIASSLSWTIN